MNFAIIKAWLVSRLFLGTSGVLLLLIFAIMFNWLNSHHHVRNGLVTAVDWVDTLRSWGEKTQQTIDKVSNAFDKAQEELQQ